MKSKPYREILKIIENNPQSVQSKNSLTDICSDRIQNWKLNIIGKYSGGQQFYSILKGRCSKQEKLLIILVE